MELEYVSCEICENGDDSLLLRARDYRFGRPEMFNIVRCEGCGLIYLNPRPDGRSILNLYVEDYTPVESMGTPDITSAGGGWRGALKPIWNKLTGICDVRQFPVKGKFLDVGCGRGLTMEIARDLGAEVHGTELNPREVRICEEKGLNVHCGTLEEIGFPSDYFDTVWMSQVVEHLPHPKRTLREIERILTPGGSAYIFCPNAGSYLSGLFRKYWHGWYVPFHFFSFTGETIGRLVEEAGLVVERIKTKTPDNFFLVSLKSYLFGEKEGNMRPVERGKILDSPIFRAIISPLFRLMDWVSPGKGDCLIVVIRKERD